MVNNTYKYNSFFSLESGGSLDEIELNYTTYGKLNSQRDNVIWVCHALTGNSDVSLWWSELIGENKLFDTNKFFIICVNIIGSCYGSTGPLSINPKKNVPYFHTFPLITNRDIVKSFQLIKNHLKISKIHTLIGGSLGGQQALEWGIMEPESIENLIIIAASHYQSPWAIAINESERKCIELDNTWKNDNIEAGKEGMKIARSIAMISYRTHQIYTEKQKDNSNKFENFKASTYQIYQGEKLAKRFNAFSYYCLTKMLDSHNIERNREPLKDTLKKIKAKTLLIGIDTDILYPVYEIKEMLPFINSCVYNEIKSIYGHDAFLIENKQIENIVKQFWK